MSERVTSAIVVFLRTLITRSSAMTSFGSAVSSYSGTGVRFARISPDVNCVVWMLKYALPSIMPLKNAFSAPAVVPPLAVMNDAFQCRRNSLVSFRKIGGVFSEDRANRVGCGLAAECTSPGQHLVQDRAKGEDVRAMVCLLPSQLFRRHVAYCAHDSARIGVDPSCGHVGLQSIAVRSDKFGYSEVQDLHPPIFSDKQVVGF